MKIYVNLKANHNRSTFFNYSLKLDAFLGEKYHDIVVFPPATAFNADIKYFLQGAQNFYPALNGPYTGELCKIHLDEFKITNVLIGHSERRALKDELIKEKLDFAMQHKLDITYCLGESKEVFEEGLSLDFLQRQLSGVDLNYRSLKIAYEPIYSIGTGLAADIKEVEKIISFLRQRFSGDIFYGGSVNLENMQSFKGLVDGLLISSAGLDPNNMIEILKKRNSF